MSVRDGVNAVTPMLQKGVSVDMAKVNNPSPMPDADKEGLDAAKAIAVIAANPSCIKRPVVEHPGGLLLGFRAEEWEAALG